MSVLQKSIKVKWKGHYKWCICTNLYKKRIVKIAHPLSHSYQKQPDYCPYQNINKGFI